MSPQQARKGLIDAIPKGPHPTPYAEWIQVRLDFVQAAAQYLDDIAGAIQEVTAALEYVDRARSAKRTEVSYETFQRAGFRRKDGWSRSYTLADARKDADTAAIRLRNAWELVDPISNERLAAAREAVASARNAEVEDDGRCPTCGEDGGTSCGMPNCGLL